MNSNKIILSVFTALLSFSSIYSQKIDSLSYKYKKGSEVYVRGTIKCPSERVTYLNNENKIELDLNTKLCTLFREELDTVGDRVRWLASWSKFDDELLIRSSLINIYKGEKLKLNRSMSYVTWPSYKNEEEFRKSLYFRISQVKPNLKKEQLDSISKIEVLLTIIKDTE